MKTGSLVLCLVLGLSATQVNASTRAPAIEVKLTMAPLNISTVRPTLAPITKKILPTKAMIINRPPTLVSKKVSIGNASHISDIVPTVAPLKMNSSFEAEMKSDINIKASLSTATNISEIPEAISTAVPPMVISEVVTSSIPEEKKESTKEMDITTNVAQVMGFITGNGNIYEITNSNGLGTIDMGRQSTQEQQQKLSECKIGGLFIFSDIPCDKLSNITIEELLDSPDKKENMHVVEQQKPKHNKINKVVKRKPQRQNLQQQQRLQQKLVQEWYDDLDDEIKQELRTRQQNLNREYKRRIANNRGQMRPLNNNNNINSRLKPVNNQQKKRLEIMRRQQKLGYQTLQPLDAQNRRRSNRPKKLLTAQSRQFVKKNCLNAECNGVSRRVNNWIRSVQKFL